MASENEAERPLLEPAEGARPEQEAEYERDESELTEQPLEEPAEGAPGDAGNGVD